MRLTLWAPRPDRGWPARLAPHLARATELTVVAAAPARRPPADLDLYHVADDPAHGFVYGALQERPGLVVLEDWNLHALVFAWTAGCGDAHAYRREARRERAATGDFVARQVLQGSGGALPQLLPLNGRVLEAAVVLVATRPEVRARAARRLVGRPAVLLPLDSESAPDELSAAALLELAEDGVARVEGLARECAERRALEQTPLGRALDELRSRGHELGLAEPPRGVHARIGRLLPGPPPRS